MSETPDTPQNDDQRQSSREAWQEIGKQFEQLGDSLAQAVRTAWNDEENRRRVQQMQAGLESMVREVGQAIHETASTPEGQQVREEAHRAAQSLVNAGEQTVQEVRPHLLSALKQLNDELDKMVSRMEERQHSRSDNQPPNQTPPTV